MASETRKRIKSNARANIPQMMISMPASVVNMIRDNNDFIRKIQKRIEIGNKRWLNSEEAADYMGVSKNHLIRNLKDQIGYSKDKRIIVFDIYKIDEFWESKHCTMRRKKIAAGMA